MPRKAKEETNEVKEKIEKSKTSSKKTTSKKVASNTAKKETTKKTTKKPSSKTPKKAENKKVTTAKTKAASKTPAKKVASTTTKVKKTTTKKATVKKTSTSKKTTATKKVTSKTGKEPKVTKTSKKVEIVEYYDLPYRYNQTVIKLLAQTPNTLFVYWDISDEDKENYIKQYGEYFFNNTKPVLIIHNKTTNNDFEVEINDYANSWYLKLVDSNCDYEIELGRRPINEYVTISNNYLHITNSNKIESPNDHILYDQLSHFVFFRNVKTNERIKKHTNLTLLSHLGKITTVKEFYEKLYKNEAISFDRLDLNNPTSSNPTSVFK